MMIPMPQDDNILLSMLNMKLRDQYGSLSVLAEEMDWDQLEIEQRMQHAGYTYDVQKNSFVTTGN